MSGPDTDGSGDGPDLSALRPRFLRLDADELLIGTPIGTIGPEGTRGGTTWSGAAGREVPAGGDRPRIVLERLVATALSRPPCLVEFSGGRDSSVVLAVAAHVARREGLPLPIPFTQRFRPAPESDEDEWQRLVVDHLRLPDWEVMTATDELDLTGPYARRLLHACGVVAPAPLYAAIPGFERAGGGTRMTGEGGDEVFGPRRVTMLTRARREPLSRLARPGTLRRTAEPLAPEAVRRARWRRRLTADLELSWIRPPARRRVLDRLARHLASEPLDWRRSLHWHLAVGTTRMLDHNAAVLASAYGVTTLDPLLHPSFVASWGRHVGFFGVADRTEALRLLVPDLLPDTVLSRRTKAIFNNGYLTTRSRRFAAAWSGRGVDTGVVDTEHLVAEWQRPRPSVQSFALLQTAWLADQG